MTMLRTHDHRDPAARQSIDGGLTTGMQECVRAIEANSH